MKNGDHMAIVTISVEVVLMRKGGPQYQLVLARLERDYNCKIFDCFEHQDYLRAVLKDVYGKEYNSIVGNIEAELGEIAFEKDVAHFLDVLKK